MKPYNMKKREAFKMIEDYFTNDLFAYSSQVGDKCFVTDKYLKALNVLMGGRKFYESEGLPGEEEEVERSEHISPNPNNRTRFRPRFVLTEDDDFINLDHAIRIEVVKITEGWAIRIAMPERFYYYAYKYDTKSDANAEMFEILKGYNI